MQLRISVIHTILPVSTVSHVLICLGEEVSLNTALCLAVLELQEALNCVNEWEEGMWSTQWMQGLATVSE